MCVKIRAKNGRGWSYGRNSLVTGTTGYNDCFGAGYQRSLYVTGDRYFIGAFMFTGFNFLGAIDTMFDIMSNKVGGNVNILVFLVLLGIIVSAIQKSGASQAYGNYAARKINGKRSALLVTFFWDF